MTFNFTLHTNDGRARAGTFTTPHGDLHTPVFMPVGTSATVKAITPAQLSEMGASIILANAYHLYLRPGDEVIADLGGLHEFMTWPHPILTDSGGFQVFSQGENSRIDDDGVTFKSHIDGSTHRFTPEKSIAIQENLGADIIMAFDECAEPHDRETAERAMQRTHTWLERCIAAKKRNDQALFGIVQGAVFPDLRERSAHFVSEQGLPGVAIGGLSVGESKEEMHQVLDMVEPILPPDRPRYLMGVGTPGDLVACVGKGIDMFDCVLPTRMGRNKTVFLRSGQRLPLKNAPFANDPTPIDEDCACYTCRNFSRAYLRHLIIAREMLAATLLSIHNLHTLIQLTADMRESILAGEFETFAAQWHDEGDQRTS
ncbi:MAG: tRNA guanosine(34) transglycosylase Tgt [Anaerolineales bacterium]|jgi:queuine tRNA-ribosyltransferase